ncbi:hypothetical protein PR202_ga15341 [Eleusine coracana subsp. coracana]|uniref:DUF3615 domain-containing protein n=1 Tax=Eleusine coracana subsp. coracana TaxID=191504 RepID=A0AAV5CJG8_ELECO|nr:hypothetical protein PR202_ga15341 [Eleusine coracana subsp. coracana]
METTRPVPVNEITVDQEGFFHTSCPGSPFRSVAEAAAAIRGMHFPDVPCTHLYGQTITMEGLFPAPSPRRMLYFLTIDSGMFNVHPPSVGGPFESLSDAMAAIELHRTPPRISPWPKEYFTIKDGLFHIHPSDFGGPFVRLDDAFAALQKHLNSLKPRPPFDYWKDATEKARRMRKMLNEMDPADFFRPVTTPQNSEPRKSPKEDIDDSEPEMCDPDVLKVLQYLHEIKRYTFHKLDYQCLIYDGPNIYHHYNFTMDIKLRSNKHWDCETYFAEVKSMANGKQYFCCPLEDTDDGK